MPKEVRKAYLEAIRERYLNSQSRAEKSKILDEFCNVCGYRRKYAVRILNRYVEPGLRRPGPAPKYSTEVITHLKQIWLSMNKMCSKNMKVALPQWLPFYPASDEIKSSLQQMSPSTMDRYLRPFKSSKMKGLSSTRPAAASIKNRVPIKLLDEQVKEPGWGRQIRLPTVGLL